MLDLELGSVSFPDILTAIRRAESSDLIIKITEDCPFSENLLAFKIIKGEAKRLGKRLIFASPSLSLSGLVDLLNEDAESFGFVRGFDLASLSAPPVPKRDRFLPLLRSFLTSRLSPIKDFGFITAILLGLGLAILYLLFYILPRATITLSVEAESLVKSIEVVASPSAQRVEVASRVIPAVEISLTGRKSGSATSSGSREVGERARGEVTIFNKTGSDKNFPVKTPLYKGRTQGPDLVFLTDGEVTLPAQSAAGISGVATVSAVAERIGDESNISANNTLGVVSFPTNSFIAETARNFSGGSRRIVTVVTADDQKKLQASLKADLDSTLREEIKNRLVPGQKLEEGSLNFEPTTKDFDKNVGEEAASFSLVLEEKATALVYSDSDLKSLLTEVLESYVPDNYELFGKDQSQEVVAVKFERNNLIFTTKVRGFIVPKIDEEKLKKELLGLSRESAQKYLGSISKITSFQLSSSPNFPGFSFLPRRQESIKVEIQRR